MGRVVFHDPYLEVLGGGEKYLLTILERVAAAGRHEVVLLSPRRPQPERWRRLGVAVDGRLRWRAVGRLAPTPLSAGADLFVTVANHFPPLSLAARSVVILQFPHARLRGRGPLEALRCVERALRLRSYDAVVCYSRFVAAAIRERLGIASPVVIPPPVDVPSAPPAVRRARLVIAVGRFFAAADANNKKHGVLIDAWRRLGADGWRLALVGGLHEDRRSLAHLDALRQRARGLSVEFHPNADPATLARLYGEATLFWHAAGYGEAEPERHEHFGITTVEAMAHGCVPVVVGLGGQLEIVSDGVDGRLWQTVDELVDVTRELIADPVQRRHLSLAAHRSAQRFAKRKFLENIDELILGPAGIDVR